MYSGHGPDDGAVALVAVVRGWLDEPGVDPSAIAVLTRVNSLLLAPHVALHEAGIAIASVLRPDVLERTGIRATLAYLRIAAATGGLHRSDIVEILRRPDARAASLVLRAIAAAEPVDAESARRDRRPPGGQGRRQGQRLVDDLRLVVDAGRDGTTRDVLETVRDDVGLGTAMNLLDAPAAVGLEPPRRPRGASRRRRPPPRPGRVRSVATRRVPAPSRPSRRDALDDPPGEGT